MPARPELRVGGCAESGGMRPDLVAVASRHHGLFTRRQALVAGYSEREIRRLTQPDGSWVSVRRGVYVERELWEAVDPRSERPVLRDHAAELTLTVPHVMSHDSAARALGLPQLRPREDLVHITRPRPSVGGSRTRFGIKHHLSILPPDLVEVAGLHVTGLARTVLDLGREHGFEAGVAAVDAARRRGVRRAELDELLDGMRYWPGIVAAREAVVFSDPGAETVGESMARILVAELDIGPAETQFAVRVADGGTVWCDLRVGCHVFEFDGRVKYLRREDGGVSDREASEIVWEEKKRERLISTEGLGVSRIIWEDYWGAARTRARRRLRAEFDLSARRFGVVLPQHMSEYSRRMRARRLA